MIGYGFMHNTDNSHNMLEKMTMNANIFANQLPTSDSVTQCQWFEGNKETDDLISIAAGFIAEELNMSWFRIRLVCHRVCDSEGKTALSTSLSYMATEQDDYHSWCALDCLNAMSCVTEVLKGQNWREAVLFITHPKGTAFYWCGPVA